MKNIKVIEVKKLGRTYQVPIKQSAIGSIFWPKYQEFVAVDNVSFSIDEGESVALLGPNGAGKTTTLKMLTGLLHPTTGEIKVLGFDPVKREEEYLKQIAMVMGNKNGLPWDLSSRHGYKLFEAIYDLNHEEAEKNINELAEILEVGNCLERPVRKLSLGQRLKMELIGALLHKPRVLFLDEPTLGLDIIAKRNIREFLKKRNKKEGTTIMLTSHDMADVEKVSDRVLVINQGKMVFDGAITKLVDKYSQKKYLTITFEEPIKSFEKKIEGKVIERNHNGFAYTLEIPKKSVAKTIGFFADNYPVDDIDIRQVPLEEIIADLFRG